MTELLSRPMMPTAVFAEYDELAIGALWALRRAGLRVPDDISVVSIDDHEMATMFDLTTIAQDVSGQGAVAAGLLLEAVDAGEVSPDDRQVLLPTRLVLRGTTAPPATEPAARAPARSQRGRAQPS
jgi:DNA-binding LacI/PurR family transcriptional regulator